MEFLRMLSVLALAPLLVAAAEPDGEPLVRVNGHTITSAELERYMAVNPREALRSAGLAAQDEDSDRATRRELLNALIEHHVVLQKAREELGDSEGMRAALEGYGQEELHKLESRVGSRLKAQRLLAQAGLTAEQYKQMRIERLLVARHLWEEVLSKQTVRPAEIREYYREHRDEFRRPKTIVYRQILLTVLEEDNPGAVRDRAERVLARLRNGAEFAEMADRHSADADRYPGGLRRVEIPEQTPDWRPACLEGLEPGEVSDVCEMGGGLAIARLERVVQPHVLGFAETQERIRNALLERRRQQAHAQYVARLREGASIRYLPAGEDLRLANAR